MSKLASPIERYRQASENTWSSFINTRFESSHLKSTSLDPRDIADAELEAMQKHLAVARQKRNEVFGACKLMPELLSDIFRSVQDRWKPERLRPREVEASDNPRYSLGWMSLTHVCHKWRQVAVKDPLLWTTIECLDVHPLAIYTIVSRTQTRPLRLRFDVHYFSNTLDDYTIQAFKAWLSRPVCPRVQTLSIFADSASFENSSLVDLLPPTLPNADELCILFGQNDVVTFREEFVPKLKTLRLDGCHLESWDCSIFMASLTRLTWAVDDRDTTSTYLPISELSILLSRLPKLSWLSLDNVLHALPNDPIIPACSLPVSLGVLRLYSSEEGAIATLFNTLAIPASITIVIRFREWDRPDAIRQISAAMFQGAYEDEREVRELGLGTRYIYMRPWQTETGLLKQGMETDYNVFDRTGPRLRCLCLYDPEGDELDDEDYAGDASLCIPYIPLSSVEALTLGEVIPFITSADDWITNFSAAQDVRYVYMPFGDHVVLEFFDLKFGSPEGGQGTEINGFKDENKASVSAIMALMSILEKRRDAGSPIRELRVTEWEQSKWPGDAWSALSELVQLSFFDE
ncbi:hypothetical protein PENSPDRAFT_756558 [Peniophora sp. CONT]|nr:hypothetical protein PENSPDRAFT_756558 [Peniophora sp. CONT]